MYKKKIIFVGSHLSAQRGTKGISEKIAHLLVGKYNIILVSHYENLVLRLLDIILNLLIKQFDIVHIDVFSNKGFIYANIASRIVKIKNEALVMTLHGGMLAEKYEREPDYVRTVLRRADVLQSPSLFLIEFFGKKGIKVEYMPNFIETVQFPYDRSKVKAHSMLWVRAFSPEYRPELAIRTVYALLDKYPDICLTMIGPDKGILPEMQKLINELKLEQHIKIIGKVPNEKLYQYYQSHAVYLNTTAYESFGVAVVEAALCGIPIISTNVGEIPYMWNEDEEILIVEHPESTIMAEKVDMIFSSFIIAEKLSKNARKKAENFDWIIIKPKWIDLVERMTLGVKL